jgi:hypothetical protein
VEKKEISEEGKLRAYNLAKRHGGMYNIHPLKKIVCVLVTIIAWVESTLGNVPRDEQISTQLHRSPPNSTIEPAPD